jgi:hypothetical protein
LLTPTCYLRLSYLITTTLSAIVYVEKATLRRTSSIQGKADRNVGGALGSHDREAGEGVPLLAGGDDEAGEGTF